MITYAGRIQELLTMIRNCIYYNNYSIMKKFFKKSLILKTNLLRIFNKKKYKLLLTEIIIMIRDRYLEEILKGKYFNKQYRKAMNDKFKV
jgi:hypothetical protein